jgi:hypothetical protein
MRVDAKNQVHGSYAQVDSGRKAMTTESQLTEIAKHERRSLSKQVALLLEKCLEIQGRESISSPTKGARRRELISLSDGRFGGSRFVRRIKDRERACL